MSVVEVGECRSRCFPNWYELRANGLKLGLRGVAAISQVSYLNCCVDVKGRYIPVGLGLGLDVVSLQLTVGILVIVDIVVVDIGSLGGGRVLRSLVDRSLARALGFGLGIAAVALIIKLLLGSLALGAGVCLGFASGCTGSSSILATLNSG